MNEEQAGIYLAAMIEGEGYVSRPDCTRAMTICNTDIFLLDRIAEALNVLGVEYRLYGMKYVINAEKGRTSTRIAISHTKNFQILWEWCGPWMVTHKRDNLRHLASYVKPKPPGFAGRRHSEATRLQMSDSAAELWEQRRAQRRASNAQ